MCPSSFCTEIDGGIYSGSSRSYKYVSKITEQFSRWTTVYLLCSKDQTLASFQVNVASTVIPFSSQIIRFRADKGAEYTGKAFQMYFQYTAADRCARTGGTHAL